MQRAIKTYALGCVLVAASAFAFVACTDLFHSTSDVLTACEIDAAGCPVIDAGTSRPVGTLEGDAAPADFCSWTSAFAQQTAAHACGWLGACQTPLGGNAFGSCLFDALLAYDCASNPSHRPKGEAYRLWACLAAVRNCDDVSQCVLPSGSVDCQGPNYVACAEATGSGGTSGGTASQIRIECSDAGYHGEDCALWGGVCNTTALGTVCTQAGSTCVDSGAPSSCSGSTLTCSSGEAVFDCAGNGSQACAAAPDAGPACVPDDSGLGATCTPDAGATCAGGVATSCPTGALETVHCGTLLGVGNSNAACTPGPLAAGFDWTSPCALTPPQCTADTCGDGGSGAGSLVGCMRGATVTLDCAAEGLGSCRLVPTNAGADMRPACTAPSAPP